MNSSLKKGYSWLLCLVSISLFNQVQVQAQTFTIEPYLQNASPNDIYILWETASGEESTVAYGSTSNLGNITEGTSFTTDQGTLLHEVHITGLERFTNY